MELTKASHKSEFKDFNISIQALIATVHEKNWVMKIIHQIFTLLNILPKDACS